MSAPPRSTDHVNPNQVSDTPMAETPNSESIIASAAESASKRGFRTINACEQCQRRKTKCTGQPSPCEACEKIGVSCNFDSKTNWKVRSRATYSAEDGRLQYMLSAVLSALKYSDEQDLNSLMVALRQNDSPETVAMHLRNNMNTLREHGHISDMVIDQADLIALASRITEPSTSDAPPLDTDSSFDTDLYHIDSVDRDRLNFQTSMGMPEEELPGSAHSIPANTGYDPPSVNATWDPASRLSATTSDRSASASPWTEVPVAQAQILQQGQYDWQQLEFANGYHFMAPGAAHRPHYVEPNNTQFGSSFSQAHLARQDALSTVHEDMAAEFDSSETMFQPRQRPISHRTAQMPSSGEYQQSGRSNTNPRERSGDS